MVPYDTLWINAHIATMSEDGTPFGAIRDAAIASRDGAIAWVGKMSSLPAGSGLPVATAWPVAPSPAAAAAFPASFERLAEQIIDAGGRCITPGIVDPHTHLVFGGDRVADFERRVADESYVAGENYVAASGEGRGIAHTVAMTRACDEEALFAASAPRLLALVRGGATTVEIKSGYGLDVDTELRMLRVARRLGDTYGITVRTTYLGAHVIPTEYRERRDAYLDLVCDAMIPRIARERLADAVDVFCDAVAFSARESARVLEAAQSAGLAVKVHADQIEDTGAAELAARFGALSADHLERSTPAGVRALAEAGTAAVLLPGAFYYLRETVKPPIAALRASGVPMALATDCNPGTSPIASATTILNMACVLFGLTPGEAVAGATRNAARALGLADRGVLRVGARCDLALWDVASPAELCYWLGTSPCAGIVVAGERR